MSSLTTFNESCPETSLYSTHSADEISKALEQVGVLFEQWPTLSSIGVHSTFDEILAAYDGEIQRIVKLGGYQSWDVVALDPDNPNKTQLRQKFLDEHTHGEDEVRFFVSGQGLFTLHIKDKVYNVLCQRGDFISVPAKVPHWFDMGTEPHFIAIRLFNNPDGWIATYTGSDIANSFPRLDEICCV